ncbi:ribonuclease H-like YkuK family protein [Paenibacillus sp. GCM10027626]|uniref:ribonuclease H-like YkuK family protein n=1 Tax=Paenibacillus sp. GCM10027626 TaxID=3273411 RepID=UPI00362C9DF8
MSIKKSDPAETLTFKNLMESGMSIENVQSRILRFIARDPEAVYHFAIGTDSQVHKSETRFVTGVVIHRLGKGAWACYREVNVPRRLMSLKEKLSMETAYSQEIAYYFAEEARDRMEHLLLPYIYKGASLELFIDIDAGTIPLINDTAPFVQEMVSRVRALGIYKARVKPDSYVASAYANRYTK